MLTLQFRRYKTQSPGVNKYFFHRKIVFTIERNSFGQKAKFDYITPNIHVTTKKSTRIIAKFLHYIIIISLKFVEEISQR